MRLGIVTPVVTRLPRAHARWEGEAGIAEIERVVLEAERLGYDHVTCSEHVAIPIEVAERRGGTYWDPLAVFGYLAARTTTIRFVTFVLVLGYHHPLEIVKRYGTLDVVSGGRLVLGVGVGSLVEEFALLGAEFADRGARADDAIRALRASFGHEEPEHHGTHYSYSGLLVRPAGIQAPPPIWIGGRTARSLRRAVELGDGWAPFGLSPDQIRTLLQEAAPRDVVLQPEPPVDPIGDPDSARDAVATLRDAGATTLNLRFVHHSCDHYCEQLAAMRALVDAT
ncbi:MAG TPA: LLM class F420-dependent oxidoreductase [Acidimicrobiia bacterium]